MNGSRERLQHASNFGQIFPHTEQDLNLDLFEKHTHQFIFLFSNRSGKNDFGYFFVSVWYLKKTLFFWRKIMTCWRQTNCALRALTRPTMQSYGQGFWWPLVVCAWCYCDVASHPQSHSAQLHERYQRISSFCTHMWHLMWEDEASAHHSLPARLPPLQHFTRSHSLACNLSRTNRRHHITPMLLLWF